MQNMLEFIDVVDSYANIQVIILVCDSKALFIHMLRLLLPEMVVFRDVTNRCLSTRWFMTYDFHDYLNIIRTDIKLSPPSRHFSPFFSVGGFGYNDKAAQTVPCDFSTMDSAYRKETIIRSPSRLQTTHLLIW